MIPNPFFIEKSMEQHNREMERAARKGWMERKEKQPSPEAGGNQAQHNPPRIENGVSCQA